MSKTNIFSTENILFSDRQDAGRLLAARLPEYRGKNAVVLGIPRGGIIVAHEIAEALDADLDIVLSRKLRTPWHEELAMGSVAENGKVFLNQDVISEINITPVEIDREKEVQMTEITRRSALIRKVRPRVPLTGRIVIVTDDGIATGATIQAALWSVRQEKPSYLIAAIPVGPAETIGELSGDVDEIVCLSTPPFFTAVGQFYQNFNQVEDGEVLEILESENKRRTAGIMKS